MAWDGSGVKEVEEERDESCQEYLDDDRKKGEPVVARAEVFLLKGRVSVLYTVDCPHLVFSCTVAYYCYCLHSCYPSM